MNCDSQTLRTMQAYAAFIEKTMEPITEQYKTLPAGAKFADVTDVEYLGIANAPQFTGTDLFCAAVNFRMNWRSMQHTRHMRVVYGKIV